MTILETGSARNPMAGWVIAQCHGLTLLGRPAKVEREQPAVVTETNKVIGHQRSMVDALSPVFEIKPQLVQQGQGMTTVHIVVPLWLFTLDEVELPSGAIVVPCENLSPAEQNGLAARLADAEQLMTQMRAAAAGVQVARQMPKVRG